jgi:hypothetical protein
MPKERYLVQAFRNRKKTELCMFDSYEEAKAHAVQLCRALDSSVVWIKRTVAEATPPPSDTAKAITDDTPDLRPEHERDFTTPRHDFNEV